MKYEIINNDALSALKQMDSESVNCVVTSPPYWGLRDYQTDNQIGQEPSFHEYISKMVNIFREVKRVLRPDGTVWVNLGDSYAASGKDRTREQAVAKSTLVGGLDTQSGILKQIDKVVGGLKPKDLVGIPWRFAFALQDDGWWLRGDHIWAKPNGMPESVRDRPGRAHEYVFMFTKSQRYWYDSESVRTAPKPSAPIKLIKDSETTQKERKDLPETQAKLGVLRDRQRGHTRRHAGFNDRWDAMEKADQMAQGANLRSVWWIPPAQCKEAHFAVMPNRVAEICVRAGCPENGLVLDPFNGAGTTGVVSLGLNRRYVGVETNPDYIEISHRRIRKAYPLWIEEEVG